MKPLIGMLLGFVVCVSIIACTKSPQPIEEVYSRVPWFAYESPSIDEQILRADIIVAASLESVRAGVQTVPGESGTTSTYRPMQVLRFHDTEYLKGSGPNEFNVEVLDDGEPIYTDGDPYDGYLTEAEAQAAATEILSKRNTNWDNRPAVLFLNGPFASATYDSFSGQAYQFVQSNYAAQGSFEYTVDTLSRTWLPARETPTNGANGASDSDEFIIDGSVDPPTIRTLGSLQTRIGEIAALLAAGEGHEGYEKCIYQMLTRERYYRDWTPLTITRSIASGSEVGTVLIASEYVVHPQYNVYSVSGIDAEYFETVIRDNDTDASNGYYYDDVTTRPLVAGEYTAKFHQQHHSGLICNHNPIHNNYSIIEATVTAPGGTLHEAFFDPVESREDEVSPASFSVGGTDTEITGLEWADGKVVLSLDTYVSLDGYTLDFIELDGSVSLSLRVEDATIDSVTGTYSWPVADQPWANGDKLMLRIRED